MGSLDVGFHRMGMRRAGATAENPLTFSTGLTRSGNTITANISTGVNGGQTINGGTGSAESLTIRSSSSVATLTGFINLVAAQVLGPTGPSASAPGYAFQGGAAFTRAGIGYDSGADRLRLAIGGTSHLVASNFVVLQSGGVTGGFYVGSGLDGGLELDYTNGSTTRLHSAVGIVDVRNTTNQQRFRVYNTFSGAGANFERGLLSWNANLLSIGAEAAGTGTLRSVSFVGADFTFANAILPGVTAGTAIGASGQRFGTVFANQFETPGASNGFVLSGTATNITLTGASTQTINKTNGALFIQTSDANDVVLRAGTGPTESFRILGASGRIQFASASLAANGAVATALTSVGPTGSHTTVQEWLTCVGTGGNQRWIPCF